MIKLTKKELKSPDQIWQASRSLLTWLMEEIVIVLVVVVLLIGGAVGGVYWYLSAQKKEAQAQFIYAQAKESFDEWSLAKVPSGSNAENQMKASLEKLEKEYPSSLANQWANRLRAELAERNKDYPKAITYLEAYVKALPSSDKALGLYPLAGAYEEAKEYEKALKTYESVSAGPDSAYQSLALIAEARVLKLLNKKEEAQKRYERFLEKYPDSIEAPYVRGLLAQVSR